MRFRSLIPCSLLLTSLFAVGCGGPKLVPVEGKVMVGDKPLTKGEVMYHPDVEGGNTQKFSDFPRGKIDENGNYALSFGGKPGAPVGKYKVTVNPNAGFIPEAGKEVASLKYPIERSSVEPSTTTIRKEVKADAPAGHYDVTVNPAK